MTCVGNRRPGRRAPCLLRSVTGAVPYPRPGSAVEGAGRVRSRVRKACGGGGSPAAERTCRLPMQPSWPDLLPRTPPVNELPAPRVWAVGERPAGFLGGGPTGGGPGRQGESEEDV